MTTMNGSCRCGNVRFRLETSFPAEGFSPRACDCDFCVGNGVAYVSDPEGSARVDIGSGGTSRPRQGSETAEFLKCDGCGAIAAVFYSEGGSAFASFNANLLAEKAAFAPPTTVSPKALSREEKISRWKRLWFRGVEVRGTGREDQNK